MRFSANGIALLVGVTTAFAFEHLHEAELVAAEKKQEENPHLRIVDAGILSPEDKVDDSTTPKSPGSSTSRKLQIGPPCTGGSDYVYCIDGFDISSGQPCHIACGGGCCVDSKACEHFTGRVCKDGSCVGQYACYAANILKVVSSCIGNNACSGVQKPNGAEYVQNSCKGASACTLLGAVGGTVGNLLNSCLAELACAQLGRQGGRVGNLQNSCNDFKACQFLGQQVQGSVGTIGYFINSCNSPRACYVLGYKGGVVGNLQGSCNFYSACKSLGLNNGIVGNVIRSCGGTRACQDLGVERGFVKSLQDSCNQPLSCRSLGASSGGSVGAITVSCNNYKACYKAGCGLGNPFFGPGPILSDLDFCCSGSPRVCYAANENNLPCVCRLSRTCRPTSSPSASPTTALPTASPSARPTTALPTASPSASPTTATPTASPSASPATVKPTASPSASPTTANPTTASPSASPTTSTPTTTLPTISPSSHPTTANPTSVSPSSNPTTSNPTIPLAGGGTSVKPVKTKKPSHPVKKTKKPTKTNNHR